MVIYPNRVEGAMEGQYTAVVQQREPWWIGWIEEVPGVNCQGETREKLLDNLRSALEEALEMNRADAVSAAGGAPFEEVRLSVAA
jgi:predicted RNase H-like HicB family nuclease